MPRPRKRPNRVAMLRDVIRMLYGSFRIFNASLFQSQSIGFVCVLRDMLKCRINHSQVQVDAVVSMVNHIEYVFPSNRHCTCTDVSPGLLGEPSNLDHLPKTDRRRKIARLVNSFLLNHKDRFKGIRYIEQHSIPAYSCKSSQNKNYTDDFVDPVPSPDMLILPKVHIPPTFFTVLMGQHYCLPDAWTVFMPFVNATSVAFLLIWSIRHFAYVTGVERLFCRFESNGLLIFMDCDESKAYAMFVYLQPKSLYMGKVRRWEEDWWKVAIDNLPKWDTEKRLNSLLEFVSETELKYVITRIRGRAPMAVVIGDGDLVGDLRMRKLICSLMKAAYLRYEKNVPETSDLPYIATRATYPVRADYWLGGIIPYTAAFPKKISSLRSGDRTKASWGYIENGLLKLGMCVHEFGCEFCHFDDPLPSRGNLGKEGEAQEKLEETAQNKNSREEGEAQEKLEETAQNKNSRKVPKIELPF